MIVVETRFIASLRCGRQPPFLTAVIVALYADHMSYESGYVERPAGSAGALLRATLRRYLQTQPGSRADNETILLNCMNGEQYIAYKNNPLAELNRGWFRRV